MNVYDQVSQWQRKYSNHWLFRLNIFVSGFVFLWLFLRNHRNLSDVNDLNHVRFANNVCIRKRVELFADALHGLDLKICWCWATFSRNDVIRSKWGYNDLSCRFSTKDVGLYINYILMPDESLFSTGPIPSFKTHKIVHHFYDEQSKHQSEDESIDQFLLFVTQT